MKTKAISKKQAKLIVAVVTALAIILSILVNLCYIHASVPVLELLGVDKNNTENLESITLSRDNKEYSTVFLTDKKDIDFVIEKLEGLEFKRSSVPSSDDFWKLTGFSFGDGQCIISFNFKGGDTYSFFIYDNARSYKYQVAEIQKSHTDPATGTTTKGEMMMHVATKAESWVKGQIPQGIQDLIEYYLYSDLSSDIIYN